jgi:Domain of unknown function (DUF6458)
MGIGVSVFLIAIGAILTFATDLSVSGLNLDIVGVVLMVAGLIGLLMTLLVWGPRRRAVDETVVDRPVTGRRVVRRRPAVEERVYDEDL